MGTTLFEFGVGELRIVGGDYGRITLEGTTKPARDAIDALVGGVRGSGCSPGVELFCELDDFTPAVIEDRHAGREGTPERGVGDDAGGSDSSGAEVLATPQSGGR